MVFIPAPALSLRIYDLVHLWFLLVQQYDGIYTRSVLVWFAPRVVLGQCSYGMVHGTARCGMVCGVARYVITYVGMV